MGKFSWMSEKQWKLQKLYTLEVLPYTVFLKLPHNKDSNIDVYNIMLYTKYTHYSSQLM